MAKYISKLINDEELYYLKDAEARASLDDKTGADDFENLGYVITIQTVDDAIAEANKEYSVISFDTDTANVNEGETLTKAVVITAGDGAVTYTSGDTDIATVDNNGVVTGVSAGTCIITANIASSSNYRAATASYTLTVVHVDPDGRHDYVEIGGVKWATMNVGANSITDIGLYFQWGDTQGYTADQVGSGTGKKYFGWADYKYGNGTSSPGNTGMTKYNSTDGKTTLEVSDDAVQTNWGGQWRMPTIAEFEALGNAVNTTWTADYQGSGVSGLVCTDKTDSSKVLFFPTAGWCYNGSTNYADSYGIYWSSSLYGSDIQYAYRLIFFNGHVVWQNSGDRYHGLPVRGVFNE